jgi:quercetin dioxygenase-like cupin family protein
VGEAAQRDVQAELDEQERRFTQWAGEWHRPVVLPPVPTSAAEGRRMEGAPGHVGPAASAPGRLTRLFRPV